MEPRDSKGPGEAFTLGEWRVDVSLGTLTRGGEQHRIEPKVMAVLALLASRAGRLFPKEEILAAVWPAVVVEEVALARCVSELRRILGDEAHQPRYIETLPKRGYRVIARVSAIEPEAGGDSARDLAGEPPAAVAARATVAVAARGGPRLRWSRRLAVAAAAATLLALAASLERGGWPGRGGERGRPPIRSLAVLPLRNLSGDPGQDYFADGMTDALITELAQIGALRVISRTSAMRYKETPKALREIARELNVDAIVEGTVLQAGARVRITAQLIYVAGDEHLWAQSYERELGDVLTLQGEVAQAIAARIAVKLTPQEAARLARSRPINPAAHAAYLRGHSELSKLTDEGYREAIRYFRQALAIDPNHALAYAGLADAYLLADEPDPETSLREARVAATRALELDDTLAGPRTALACASLFDWEWAAAERGFKQAIQANSSYARAHHWYGNYLSWTGRHEEAIAEARRARELDPLSLVIANAVGFKLSNARRYDQAIEHHREILRMDPSFGRAHAGLADAYLQKGMSEVALAEFRWVAEHDRRPSTLAPLAYAYAVAGHEAQARDTLAELRRVSDHTWQTYYASFSFARIHAALGERERAFELLEEAYRRKCSTLALLKVDPAFDVLRADPRFHDLVRRLNFPD